MIKLRSILVLLIAFQSFGQTSLSPELQSTIEEGKHLFRLEKALWYGTNLLTDSFHLINRTGVYILYTQENKTKAVFFSNDIKPKVVATFTFDSLLNIKTIITEVKDRKLTPLEADLLVMQQKALYELSHDSLFKPYPYSNLDCLPIINNTERKVMIITSPTKEGRVIFGNDYSIKFNNSNQVISKKAIHSAAFPIRYGSIEINNKKVEGSMHRHDENTEPAITSTDICTLLSYASYARWKDYFVISKDMLSTWDCIKNQLIVEKIETIKE